MGLLVVDNLLREFVGELSLTVRPRVSCVVKQSSQRFLSGRNHERLSGAQYRFPGIQGLAYDFLKNRWARSVLFIVCIVAARAEERQEGDNQEEVFGIHCGRCLEFLEFLV